MAGPHSPNHAVGTDGPTPHAESQPLEFPHEPIAGDPVFASAPTNDASPNYSGQPPPVSYPRRRSKRRLVIGILVAVALVAALTVAITYGVRTNGANTGTSFSRRRPRPRFRTISTRSNTVTSTPSSTTRCAACTTASAIKGPTRRWPG